MFYGIRDYYFSYIYSYILIILGGFFMIAIACDHGGFALKQEVMKHLTERGLEFKQDGLKITFDYVARPIAGINSKAVLLDLMSNILVLTYSSGSWFGGMWRFEARGNPALYPWKYGDAMNKLYRGEILGNNGAVMTLTKHVFSDGKDYLSSFLPDAAKFISNLFK